MTAFIGGFLAAMLFDLVLYFIRKQKHKNDYVGRFAKAASDDPAHIRFQTAVPPMMAVAAQYDLAVIDVEWSTDGSRGFSGSLGLREIDAYRQHPG